MALFNLYKRQCEVSTIGKGKIKKNLLVDLQNDNFGVVFFVENRTIMQNTTENKYSFKVVLLGEGCVGKTSLVRLIGNLICSYYY